MNNKRKRLGIIAGFALALAEVSNSIKAEQEAVACEYQIRRRKAISDARPIYYASDRKSKGEKKREKSAKHKRGWK